MKLSEYCPEIAQVLSPVIGEGEGLTCMTLLHLHAIAGEAAMQSQDYGDGWNFGQSVEDLDLYDDIGKHCPNLRFEVGPEQKTLWEAEFKPTEWLKLADWARQKLGRHKLLA